MRAFLLLIWVLTIQATQSVHIAKSYALSDIAHAITFHTPSPCAHVWLSNLTVTGENLTVTPSQLQGVTYQYAPHFNWTVQCSNCTFDLSWIGHCEPVCLSHDTCGLLQRCVLTTLHNFPVLQCKVDPSYRALWALCLMVWIGLISWACLNCRTKRK